MEIANRKTTRLIMSLVLIAATGLFGTDFLPTDDTYIRAVDDEYTNFGTEEEVYVRQVSPTGEDKYNRAGYVKFDISSYSGTIGHAELQMTVIRTKGSSTLGTEARIDFFLLDDADDGWSESVITWNNAPAHWDNTPSNYLFSFEFLPHATDDPDTTYTFDVTQYVAADANGIISFFMADTVRVNSTSQFWSKENTNGSPPITLVILETAATFLPTDDTYIRAVDDEYTNFGTEEEVYVRQVSPTGEDKYNRAGYVKFDISSYSGTIGHAELQMTVIRTKGSSTLGTEARIDFFLLDDADDGWSESVITWNNAPAHWDNTPSNYLFSFEFLPHATDDPDTTYTFDVTQYVAADANGIISFFMADTVRVNSTSQFWSKENTNGSPPITLVILETAGLDQDVAKMPQAFSLSQNYPNPFNPKTTIDFSLQQNTNISITIFDILGNQVKTLAKSMIQAGDHSIVWDGTNENNQSVPTGVYFCQMTGNNYKQTIKMLLMK